MSSGAKDDAKLAEVGTHKIGHWIDFKRRMKLRVSGKILENKV